MLTTKTGLTVKQLTLEESREANTATREAAHRISRGLHNKVVYTYNLNLEDNKSFIFCCWINYKLCSYTCRATRLHVNLTQMAVLIQHRPCTI